MKFQTPLTVLGGGPGMHSSPGLGRARGSEECWWVVKEALCVFTPGSQVINDSDSSYRRLSAATGAPPKRRTASTKELKLRLGWHATVLRRPGLGVPCEVIEGNVRLSILDGASGASVQC